MNEQANKEETLVPIRLDVENDGYKIRDTFTWNINGKISFFFLTDLKLIPIYRVNYYT